MFRWFQTPQEETAIKTPHERLIEFLEKRGLKEEADSLRNGGTTLNLYCKNIDDAGASDLAAILKDNKSLTELYLYSNNIGDAGASSLAAILKDNKSLKSLSLYANNIGDAGASNLAASLKDNKSLTYLDLAYNKIGEAGARDLAASLKDNNSLTSLSLYKNNIGDTGASNLAASLKDNNSLTSLSLGGNNIGDAGAMALAASLKDNKSLTKLCLGENNIGDAGAISLGASLKDNKSLTSLELRYNQIGDAGAMALAARLKDNKSLTELYLGYNKIGDAGASSLAASLKDNKSCTILYLSSNNIGEAGARSLAASLKDNNSLTSLSLPGNNIGDAGAMALAASLKDNKSLTLLSLGENNIGKATLKIINEYLQRNKNIAEKKAESLNAEANDLCKQEKYSEAIEKYKAAVKITKESLRKENKLFEENKAKAEKKYEEQQQSLKLKQEASVTNENKAADIKDSAQESLKDKLAIFQKIVTETIVKIWDNTAISVTDKNIMQNSINEITRTTQTFTNKTDIDTMIKSINGLAKNKITKARIAVVEEDLTEIIEQQVKLDEQIRTEKLTIFQNVVANMTTKIESNTTINARDKDIMQNSIKGLVIKVQRLANKTDIETITESMEELIRGKLTKARLGVVEEDIEQLIEQQNKPNHDVTVNKVTIVNLEDKIDDVIQQQIKIDSLTRIDQLNIFKLAVAKVITNLENDKTITITNKVVMENSINEIISGVSRLTNVSDIEKITSSMKEITTGRITKGKLIDLEGEVDAIIILQTNKVTDNVATFAVTEIIYDKPLLNHPKLLQAAVDSKLSSDLLQEAINNNDEELILAGLVSVGYDVGSIN